MTDVSFISLNLRCLPEIPSLLSLMLPYFTAVCQEMKKNFHIKSHQLFHSLNGFLFQLFGKCIELVLLVDNVHTAVSSH